MFKNQQMYFGNLPKGRGWVAGRWLEEAHLGGLGAGPLLKSESQRQEQQDQWQGRSYTRPLVIDILSQYSIMVGHGLTLCSCSASQL